ncbi:MAG: insulinase family protein [Candidatus Cloacimonas sp.]
MKQQKLLHGFQLIEKKEIKEIKITVNHYQHLKSGAELIHYQCEDDNKVFMIGFKTIPEDNTGCPHILEHSVLNGSKNFPAKSTFMELIKGSMNTFINAMTFPDMTCYPVASTNNKDFVNLMRVYLDAVFFPNIYREPNILHQEGWHLELLSEEDPLNYRGVVYNEMKGAFSSPENNINRKSKQAQFPDTPYGFESGGDPEAIPELTYEKFLAFHSKYYHPANSKITLYGDLDIDQTLQIIDEEYLSQFENNGQAVQMPLQKPFSKAKTLRMEIPVEEGKDIEDQYYLSMNWTYGQITDKFLPQALKALTEMLMDSPASPLKKAIQDSGYAKDSTLTVDEDILQPTIFLVCKQVKEENIEPLTQLIKKELQRIVREGLDKKLIEAVINKTEFSLREAQFRYYPKGLIYALNSQALWMHNGNPIDKLAFEPMLKELRRGLKEPYFEELIEKVLLNNKHSSQITFVPVPGLIQKMEEKTAEKLAALKKKMTKKEIANLIEFNHKLVEWQQQPETKENLEKIPMLSLKDLNPDAKPFLTEAETLNDITLLEHPESTNGIVYFKAYFDICHSEEEDLPWIELYTQLADWLNSEGYNYAKRSTEIDSNTGGISMDISLYNSYQTPDDILPKIVLRGKAVKDKFGKLMELASEYALKPLFDDPERLKVLLAELKAKSEAMLSFRGHAIALQRMLKPLSQIYHWTDITHGLGYYHFLCNLVNNMDSGIDEIMDELNWIKKTFFTTHNLILSITTDAENMPAAKNELNTLISSVSTEAFAPVETHFAIKDYNEGIYAPIQVQFCAKGGNFFRKGYSYSGKLKVLNNILRNNYIYQELRVKRGAYGNMSDFTLGGYVYFVSYRDPNLRETLEVYNTIPEFLRNFDCDKREFDKYIIGEISLLDFPLTPEATGEKADEDFITGFTFEDRQQIRTELLSTKIEDIRHYAELIEAVMSKNHYAVFGSETKVKEAADLFDAIIPAIK